MEQTKHSLTQADIDLDPTLSGHKEGDLVVIQEDVVMVEGKEEIQRSIKDISFWKEKVDTVVDTVQETVADIKEVVEDVLPN